jgi:hypothetical protein
MAYVYEYQVVVTKRYATTDKPKDMRLVSEEYLPFDEAFSLAKNLAKLGVDVTLEARWLGNNRSNQEA